MALSLLLLTACIGSLTLPSRPADTSGSTPLPQDTADPPVHTGEGGIPDTLTPHFRAWLAGSRWSARDFARDDLPGASFGGRIHPAQPITSDPVVFLHGNGDRALGGPLGGWTIVRDAFAEAGYRSSELYALTWGPADPGKVSQQHHDPHTLQRIRAFLEAVLAYTGADHVDVVAHSMGVTLARKAIAGGSVAGSPQVDLGPPLTASVDTFVGIAGANRGLLSCATVGALAPTCDRTTGLYPGALRRQQRSALLRDLDTHRHAEGTHVFSVWSPADEVIAGQMVWGQPTSAIPGQDGEHRMPSATHMGCRDDAPERLIRLVTEHL